MFDIIGHPTETETGRDLTMAFNKIDFTLFLDIFRIVFSEKNTDQNKFIPKSRVWFPRYTCDRQLQITKQEIEYTRRKERFLPIESDVRRVVPAVMVDQDPLSEPKTDG